MKEIHKYLIYLIISIVIGLIGGIIFGYITGLATSALGIIKIEEKMLIKNS